MFRILLGYFLIITPFYFLSAEDLGGVAIENLRALTKNHKGLSPEEKENTLGITEDFFNRLTDMVKLDWKTNGKHSLPFSNSSISIPNGYAILTGYDAASAIALRGISPNEYLEAYVCKAENLYDAVLFQQDKIGFISMEDWKNVDPKQLLKEFKISNDHASVLQINDWIVEPTLDQQTNTVYWAIEISSVSDKKNYVKSEAFRLGREGYVKISWITSQSSYDSIKDRFDLMLRSHSFDPGYGYHDFKKDDKIAGFGISTLVSPIPEKKPSKSLRNYALHVRGILLILTLLAVYYEHKKAKQIQALKLNG